MFKIHRFNCAGLNVHKNLIVATIGITDKKTSTTEYIQKDFSFLNFDIYNLKNWFIQHNSFDVCMESTSKYWIPIFNVLETEAKMNIVLIHLKYVKAIKGKKTDKKDSKWICDLFKHDFLKSSFIFISPKDTRELRYLSRYRFKFICMRTGERNRYQISMTGCYELSLHGRDKLSLSGHDEICHHGCDELTLIGYHELSLFGLDYLSLCGQDELSLSC